MTPLVASPPGCRGCRVWHQRHASDTRLPCTPEPGPVKLLCALIQTAAEQCRPSRRGHLEVYSTSPDLMNLDRMVAVAVMGVYVVAVVAFLPPAKFAHMLGGGALYFAAVAALAHALGNRTTVAFSILLVSFVGAAVLLVPNFPAMGGQHIVGVPIGFLGSQAGALLWISLRWKAESKPKQRTSLIEALLAGMFGAVAVSVIASIPIGIGLLSGEAEMRGVLWVYPAYMGGALAAAFLYWILQGIAHRPVGRYFIGALGGFCVYAAMGPVVSIAEEEPLDLHEMAMIGIVAGCLVGPPVAMSWSDDLRSRVGF